jgi:hypothetical protein
MLAKERAVNEKEWPLTSRAMADSDRATQGDYDLDDDEEPIRGNALLHALAAEGRIREVAPGRFYVSKFDAS